MSGPRMVFTGTEKQEVEKPLRRFRSNPFVTVLKERPNTTRKLRPLTISREESSLEDPLSFSSVTRPGVSWTDSKESVFRLDSQHSIGHDQPTKGAFSARGTRKEEFEYLTKLFSGSRRKGPAPWEEPPAKREEGEFGEQGPAHNMAPTNSPKKKGGGGVEEGGEKKRGLNGKQYVPWKVPDFEAQHRPLRLGNYRPLYDVATWSVFKDSQNFAGIGIAALSSIPADRDVLVGDINGGAVQYMVHLLLNAKTTRAKCDACEALVALFKNDQACREFVIWTGCDGNGVKFNSGFHVAFRLFRSKSHELQRMGADLLHTVLLCNQLKHAERISVEYISGLCQYCHASDVQAACKAAKTLVAIFHKVLDTGVRWTVEPIALVVELLRNTDIFPAVRTLVLKALYFFAKEGDRVLGLLSQVGAVKTITLQLAARELNKQPVDIDDLNGLRLLSQICEVDNNRYQDVILIGGAQRILQILRAHLVMHATLLPDEIEMQRKGMRFFERVLAKEPLRFACFQAGCAQLYLDILEMDKSSLKNQAMDCLSMLCEDKSVQAEWHTLGAEHTARLAHFLQRFTYNSELLCTVFGILKHLCSSKDMLRFLVGTDFMEQTIAILDSAVKGEDREEMHAILAAAVQFFYAMVMHKLGCDHVALWNVIGRIDPNMRKVRGLLVTLDCKEEIWTPYDNFLRTLETVK